MRRTLWVGLLWLLCLPLPAQAQGVSSAPLAPVIATTVHLAPPSEPCTGMFAAHDLDHLTKTDDGVVRMFEANGAGLAFGDLDDDGDLDLILGAETGPNSLLWNEGGLRFTRQELGSGPVSEITAADSDDDRATSASGTPALTGTRAITTVDIDADGALDIVLTTNRGTLNYWRNTGNRTFSRQSLPGVSEPAYSLAWADIDDDGDLDLATGSYDAGFLTELGSEYLLAGKGGIYVYENRAGRFRPTRLIGEAQALALLFFDVNNDGRPDLLVGNDFDVPDYAFLQTKAGWTRAEPFSATTHSTMSLDTGDVDNDGRLDLFASDMKPYPGEPLHVWEPLMGAMSGPMPHDLQIMENTLLRNRGQGAFTNEAQAWGVDGAGWAWSGRFGDLDNDGGLDLYVVNGMIEERMFGHAADHELVEKNQAFRNDGGRTFVAAPEWGLGSLRSGRAMGMADLDADGDLDIVVNNLRSPAQLFENRLCAGRSLQVTLSQPLLHNRSAVGARLQLITTAGALVREVTSGGGYLTGDAGRVHFGLPAGAELVELKARWPDGAVSLIHDLTPGTLLRVERNDPLPPP